MLPQYREKARQLAAGLQRMLCVSKSLHQENLDVFMKEAEPRAQRQEWRLTLRRGNLQSSHS